MTPAPPTRLDLFHAAGCVACDAARGALKAAALEEAADLVWRDIDILDELDYAVALGVLTLPVIAIDGQLIFAALPTPADLRAALARHRSARG